MNAMNHMNPNNNPHDPMMQQMMMQRLSMHLPPGSSGYGHNGRNSLEGGSNGTLPGSAEGTGGTGQTPLPPPYNPKGSLGEGSLEPISHVISIDMGGDDAMELDRTLEAYLYARGDVYEPQDGQKTRQQVIDKLLDTVRTWAAAVGVAVNAAQAASNITKPQQLSAPGAGVGATVEGAATTATAATSVNGAIPTAASSSSSSGNSSSNGNKGKAPQLAVGDGGVQLRIFGSTRLGVHAPDADIDVLCLAPCWISRGDFFTSLRAALEVSLEEGVIEGDITLYWWCLVSCGVVHIIIR